MDSSVSDTIKVARKSLLIDAAMLVAMAECMERGIALDKEGIETELTVPFCAIIASMQSMRACAPTLFISLGAAAEIMGVTPREKFEAMKAAFERFDVEPPEGFMETERLL